MGMESGRKKVVVSVGGAFFEDAASIKKIAAVLDELSARCHLFVVVGGGKRARECINIARELGANDSVCDYIGIEATRINAMLLISALKNAYPMPFRDYHEVAQQYAHIIGVEASSTEHAISVMGGVSPGQTTDAVAAILAEYLNADMLINVTTVDGVYDDDPRFNKNARRFDRLTPAELLDIVMRREMKAGASIVIDPVAAKIIERSRIKTVVIDGGDPKNILKAFNGERTGTIIETADCRTAQESI